MATMETIYRSTESRGKAKVSLMSMLNWVDGRLERRRSRRTLLEMSDDQLKDIGLSRADVHYEAQKPFWR